MCGLYDTPICKLTFRNAVTHRSANDEASPRPDCLAFVIYSNSTVDRETGVRIHSIFLVLLPARQLP
jgi:hypothetical protein